MPVEFTFTNDSACLRCSGIVTAEEFLSEDRKLHAHFNSNELKYAIVDFTETTDLHLTSETMRILADEDRRHFEKHGPFKIVVVAPSDYMFGMSRMWQIISETDEDLSFIARTMESALSWLKDNG